MGTKRDPKPHGRVIRGSASTSAEGPMRKRTTAVAHKKHKSKQPAAIGAIGWTIRSVFKVITAVLLICIIAGCIGATALTVFVIFRDDTARRSRRPPVLVIKVRLHARLFRLYHARLNKIHKLRA